MCAATVLSLVMVAGTVTSRPTGDEPARIAAVFNNEDACAGVVQMIDAATSSVYVRINSWPGDSVVRAMKAAKTRGVDTWLMTDWQTASAHKYDARQVFEAGVPVLVDTKCRFAGIHVMVDRQAIALGTGWARDSLDVNIADSWMIVHNASQVVPKFNREWAQHARHALPLIHALRMLPESRPAADGTPTLSRSPQHREPTSVTPGKSQIEQQTVYITPSGSKYHSRDCRYAENGQAVTRNQAREMGKTPCKLCEPDVQKP
jgi:hypothetical protein